MRCFLGLHRWHHYVAHDAPFRRCIDCGRAEKAVTDYTNGESYWRMTVLESQL